jgi:hypothetical protein
MKTIKLIASLLSVSVFAQTDNTSADEIFTIVENNAEFPGGPAEMYKFIQQNVKYPE